MKWKIHGNGALSKCGKQPKNYDIIKKWIVWRLIIKKNTIKKCNVKNKKKMNGLWAMKKLKLWFDEKIKYL